MKEKKEIFGLKMDPRRGTVGWFSYFAKAKMREPTSVHLRNQFEFWE
jgi:hypothetical protein